MNLSLTNCSSWLFPSFQSFSSLVGLAYWSAQEVCGEQSQLGFYSLFWLKWDYSQLSSSIACTGVGHIMTLASALDQIQARETRTITGCTLDLQSHVILGEDSVLRIVLKSLCAHHDYCSRTQGYPTGCPIPLRSQYHGTYPGSPCGGA